MFGSREAELGRVVIVIFKSDDQWSFGERKTRRATFAWFEAEFSSIHRSTSTSSTASSEDALASILRSQVACV